MPLEGFTPYQEEDIAKYQTLGWWAGRTFGDLIDRAAEICPEREALVDGVHRFTYTRVCEQVDRAALGLMEHGIQALDRVLVQLPNWHEFVFAYFGLQKLGAIPILLVPRYREYEITTICRITGAKAWILPEQYRGTDYRPIADGILKASTRPDRIILVRGTGGAGGFAHLEDLMRDVRLTHENLRTLAHARPDPMEVAHMGPTGGTTGLPKVVPRTHNDYLCRVEYVARAWELSGRDTLLAVSPVTHDLTFSIGLCSTLLTCGRVVMLDSSDPGRICRTIQEEGVTTVAWTPSFAYRLLAFEGLGDYDLSSLRVMYCGGGASSGDLVRRVTETLGCDFLNGYGGTEGMSTLPRLDYDLERRCRTVGRPTCPHDTYRILDAHGRELPPNRVGELAVKGPGIFTGYYGMPEENARAFDENGFFRTGDSAMMDEAGDIILTGRMKDIIVRGGENISPLEIENLILRHPDVEAAAVVGMPDAEMGERACAYVKTRSGRAMDLDRIVSFLRSQGASVLQLPERIEWVAEMPLTGAKGLVDKKALVEDIRKKNTSCFVT